MEHEADALVRAFVAHYQFEAIHPFMDGNGRVGRLLLAITIAEWCGLANQWLYMSDYFDRNRDRYIDSLFAVSAGGNWSDWIAFCLRGVTEQARDTLTRYESLIALHHDFHARINEQGASVRHSQLVDELFLAPILPVTRARDPTSVTYPTARSDLQLLERLGIVTELSGAPRITYACIPIFQIVYAD